MFLQSPADTHLAICTIRNYQSDIFPEELASQTRAVTRRRNEFSTGRYIAHKLQKRAGTHTAPVLSHSDRSPIWPPGTKGSISHSSTKAACILTIGTSIDGLGVDIEPENTIPKNLHGMLFTQTEEVGFREHRKLWSYSDVRHFSAKESVYKAIYPLTKGKFEFTDVELSFSTGGDEFSATYRPEPNLFDRKNQRLNSGKGYCYTLQDHVLTVFVIPTQ